MKLCTVFTAIVNRLNTEAAAFLAQPEVRDRLAEAGLLAVGGTAEQFDAHIRAETQRWGKLVRALKLRAD